MRSGNRSGVHAKAGMPSAASAAAWRESNAGADLHWPARRSGRRGASQHEPGPHAEEPRRDRDEDVTRVGREMRLGDHAPEMRHDEQAEDDAGSDYVGSHGHTWVEVNGPSSSLGDRLPRVLNRMDETPCYG